MSVGEGEGDEDDEEEGCVVLPEAGISFWSVEYDKVQETNGGGVAVGCVSGGITVDSSVVNVNIAGTGLKLGLNLKGGINDTNNDDDDW
jgi:hypothetical protein